MSYFNVRVYGLLINDNKQVLISDEFEHGKQFTKFPGGGLEYGEGLIEALKREFLEECQLAIAVEKHLYTTDFFEKSAFNESQILSVYYLVRPLELLNVVIKEQVFDFQDGEKQSFRWISLSELKTHDLTFDTDKKLVDILQNLV